MGILSGLIQNRVETTEKHKVPTLRTRYYRESKDSLMDKIQSIVARKMSRCKVVYVHKDRGEIMLEKRSGVGTTDITITVFKITPLRSAVDVVCAKRGSLGDLGAGQRWIISFFEELNRTAQLEQP